MLKGDRKYIFFLSICFISLIALQLLAPKPVDWKLSYLKKDKIPYGTSALYSVLPSLFQNNPIKVKDLPVYTVLNEGTVEKANYIIINDDFEADKLDVAELQNFVKKGNSVFISANSFSKSLMDSLEFETAMILNSPFINETDSVKAKQEVKELLQLNFYNPILKEKKGYTIEMTFGTYFSTFDTLVVTVLGSVNDKINFLAMPYGKGYFYLHSTPEIFANHNFLKENNVNYSEKVFSFMPMQQVIWDEYYKAGKVLKNNSSLRVILSNTALTTAYYLLLFSVVILMLIGIKRKQRIIPIMKPLQNTTLEFINTMGALYYQQGSHKIIAEKQIGHFLSFLKFNFRITSMEYDDTFITKLSGLSGIERDKVKGVFNYISYIKGKSQIHEQELLQLNKTIEDFYKLNKR